MTSRVRTARAAALALALLAVPAATSAAREQAGFPGLHKRLVGQSAKLAAFTTAFKADAEHYNRLARAAGYDAPTQPNPELALTYRVAFERYRRHVDAHLPLIG